MSEQYQNVTPVEQGIYTKWQTLIMVKPGQTVDRDKLGYDPDPSTGFVAVSRLAKFFKKEAPASAGALRADRITEAPAPVTESVEGLSPEELERRKAFEIDKENAPSYYAAVQALLRGKVAEDTITMPTEKDREHTDRVYEAMVNRAPKPKPATIPELREMIPARAGGVVARIDPDLVDTVLEVPMMDPLLVREDFQVTPAYPVAPSQSSEGFVVPPRQETTEVSPAPEKPSGGPSEPATKGPGSASGSGLTRYPRLED